MPVTVRPNKKKGGYDIIEISTGEVVGHSDTIGKARASAGHRNDASSADRSTRKRKKSSK